MAEHGARYDEFAGLLAEKGFEVWAADWRGHGKTADPAVNDPSSGGLLGHCADRNGFFKTVEDIDGIFSLMAPAREAPLVIIGHSWGSFLAQAYIEAHGKRLSGCILSGTRGPGGLNILFGAPFVSLLSLLQGSRIKSLMVHNMGAGSYNAAFKPNRTAYDWLSRDEAEVALYAADPCCGQMCTIGFYRDMLRGLLAIHRTEAIKRIPRSLPVLIFAGAADPVGSMGASPTTLVKAYKKHGIQDLEFVLYPEARHEMLHETNRGEVVSDILSWLDRHIK
jgi:alpha-beta hydrolase superfamily lysophospholipase